MKINNLDTGCDRQPSFDTDRINELVTTNASYAAKIAKNSKVRYDEALSACLDALWTAAQKYKAEIGKFLPFARTLMRRRLIDLCRKLHPSERNRLIVFDSSAVDDISENFGCVNDDFAVLHSALGKLPEKQRDHITKVYLEGHTREDVSREYGVSRQASCSMINRGIAKLRNTLITQQENN
jgi:RNA polymerase sigma factor (sigma-70 family)